MIDKNMKILTMFNRFIVKDCLKARAIIKQANYKNNPYFLRCIALTYKDEAMFKNETEMRRIFLKRKLDLAKKYIDKAFLVNPNCRDVLFTKGEIYNALGDTFVAIDCYVRILALEESMFSEFNCSNSDLSYVKMLFNDAHFQLYRLFFDLESFEISNDFLNQYKGNLRKGIGTMYVPLEQYLM